MTTIKDLKKLDTLGTFDPVKAGEPDIRSIETVKSGDYKMMEEAIPLDQAIAEIDKLGIENFKESRYRDGGSFTLSLGDVTYAFKIQSVKNGFKYRPFVSKYTTLAA